MVSRTCKFRKESGQPCGAAPLKDADYCLMHDPEHAEEVAEGRRLGGLRRRRERTISAAYDFEGLESIPKIRRLVEVAALDALGLDNSLSRCRALGYLAQVSISLLEKGEMEERLAAIEEAIGPRLVSSSDKRRKFR